MDPALNSSVKMDWQTPDSLLELVRRALGYIGLDPCTVRDNPTDAHAICSPEVGLDGLTTVWAGCGPVYVNPPYGRELPKWVAKCVEEAGKGAEIVLLVPARPDTRWFQNAYKLAPAPNGNHGAPWTPPTILFWKGRLKFKGAPASAPFPSALFYWGPRADKFRQVFAGRGLFL
jgi:hypothetical protein